MDNLTQPILNQNTTTDGQVLVLYFIPFLVVQFAFVPLIGISVLLFGTRGAGIIRRMYLLTIVIAASGVVHAAIWVSDGMDTLGLLLAMPGVESLAEVIAYLWAGLRFIHIMIVILVLPVSLIVLFLLIIKCIYYVFPVYYTTNFQPYWYSLVVQWFGIHDQVVPQDCRSAFRGLPRTQTTPDATHTHGEQASSRSDASSFADRLATNLGLRSFFHQMSKSDKRNNRAGSRTYYWAKDLDVEAGPGVDPSDTRLHVMVDIDYYYDMPAWLTYIRGPVFLYTFQPSEVAQDNKEYSYSFDANGMLTYTVSGGAVYTHQVWNYSSDVISCSQTFLGLPLRTTVYNVDKRYMDKNHQMVLMTPIVRFHWLGAYLANMLGTARLSRLDMFDGKYNVLKVRTKETMLLSVGRPSTYLCATLPLTTFDGLAALARVGKFDINQHQVFKQYKDELRSAVLLEYIKDGIKPKDVTVFTVEDGVNRYIIDPPFVLGTTKPSMVSFMRPIVMGSYVPDINLANEQAMVKERVEKPRAPAKQPGTTLPGIVARAKAAFLDHLVPASKRHLQHPYSIEEVYERQNSPSQRRILDTADLTDPKRIIKNFSKKEPYPGIKPPRPISQINGTDKLHYSRYTYTVADLLHDYKWYAFGTSNRAICERVSEVCMPALHVVKSDFSKFDGHVSWVLRELEHEVLLALFAPEYHSEIQDLHESQYGMKAFCPLGTVYEQFTARASGSPETSIMNSIINAFVNFLALYMMRVGTKDEQSDWAWEHLGIYGGDDGLTADVDVKQLQRASKMCFLEIACEPVMRGEFGVTFLARDYSPDVWFGDRNSMCSLHRQLSKLHLTVHLPPTVTPAMKLAEKLLAYSYTDAQSPIFNQLIEAFKRIFPPSAGDTNYLKIWNKQPDLSLQYINFEADWMYSVAEQQMPGFNYTLLHSWLQSASTVDHLLNGPVLFEPGCLPKLNTLYLINGQMISPDVQPEDTRRIGFDPNAKSTEPDRVNSNQKTKPEGLKSDTNKINNNSKQRNNRRPRSTVKTSKLGTDLKVAKPGKPTFTEPRERPARAGKQRGKSERPRMKTNVKNE